MTGRLFCNANGGERVKGKRCGANSPCRLSSGSGSALRDELPLLPAFPPSTSPFPFISLSRRSCGDFRVKAPPLSRFARSCGSPETLTHFLLIDSPRMGPRANERDFVIKVRFLSSVLPLIYLFLLIPFVCGCGL